MKAAGAYLRKLRELNGMTRAQLAEAVGELEGQLGRLERGENESRVSLWMKCIRYFNGDLEELTDLLLDSEYDIAYAERRAEHWMREQSGLPSNPKMRRAYVALRDLEPNQFFDVLSLAQIEQRESRVKRRPPGRRQRPVWLGGKREPSS